MQLLLPLATPGQTHQASRSASKAGRGRVGTWPRLGQGVGGGRVCRPAHGHASSHPSQMNETLQQLFITRGARPGNG